MTKSDQILRNLLGGSSIRQITLFKKADKNREIGNRRGRGVIEVRVGLLKTNFLKS
jgi:hypothetical protein